jgi:hypothetical protein
MGTSRLGSTLECSQCRSIMMAKIVPRQDIDFNFIRKMIALGVAFVFPVPAARFFGQWSAPSGMKFRDTYMIKQLHRHLNVSRLSSDHNQSFPFTSSWSRCSIHPYPHRPGLHNLDLTCTHMPNLIDLASSLPNDTPNEVIWDVDLLCLKLLWRIVLGGWGRRGGTVGV